MTGGLLAQWQRGIALRGIIGAGLLAIPVLVAATIGFGGVGVGLSSFASGPGRSAVDVPSQQGTGSKSIDSLSSTIPRATVSGSHSNDGGGVQGSTAGGSTSGVGSAPSSGGSGGGSSSSGGGSGGASTGNGESAPADPTLPQGSPDVVNGLLQGLGLGGPSGTTP